MVYPDRPNTRSSRGDGHNPSRHGTAEAFRQRAANRSKDQQHRWRLRARSIMRGSPFEGSAEADISLVEGAVVPAASSGGPGLRNAAEMSIEAPTTGGIARRVGHAFESNHEAAASAPKARNLEPPSGERNSGQHSGEPHCRGHRHRHRRPRWYRRLVQPLLAEDGGMALGLAALGLLVSSVGNAVLFKQMTSAVPNYGWFLSQLTCFVYVPIFGLVVLCSRTTGTLITPEMTRFPKYRFLIMGLLDSLLCLMGIIGGAFTSGPAQLILNQTVIPTTLVLSTLILRHRYHVLQYVGSVVIIAGVLVSKAPISVLQGDPDPIKNVAARPVVAEKLTFNIIYAASALPSALSQIYKEVAFRGHDLDVNYMQFWVATFQFLLGLPLAPLNALPLLGTQRVPLTRMPKMLINGAACIFLGRNSIVEDCGETGERLCDRCSGAWQVIAWYLLFNISYNVFTLLVVKHGGAALSFIIATLRLPLSTFFFYSHWIMGNDASDPQVADFLGLGVLLAGLMCYRYGGLLRKPCAAIDDSLESHQSQHTPGAASLPHEQLPSAAVGTSSTFHQGEQLPDCELKRESLLTTSAPLTVPLLTTELPKYFEEPALVKRCIRQGKGSTQHQRKLDTGPRSPFKRDESTSSDDWRLLGLGAEERSGPAATTSIDTEDHQVVQPALFSGSIWRVSQALDQSTGSNDWESNIATPKRATSISLDSLEFTSPVSSDCSFCSSSISYSHESYVPAPSLAVEPEPRLLPVRGLRFSRPLTKGLTNRRYWGATNAGGARTTGSKLLDRKDWGGKNGGLAGIFSVGFFAPLACPRTYNSTVRLSSEVLPSQLQRTLPPSGVDSQCDGPACAISVPSAAATRSAIHFGSCPARFTLTANSPPTSQECVFAMASQSPDPGGLNKM